jgi:nitric oxide dioxygenase
MISTIETKTEVPQICPFGHGSEAETIPAILANPKDAIPEAFRDIVLTEEQKAIITATVPVLEAHGLAITKTFYETIIADNPSLKSIFNSTNQVTLAQPKALAGAVYAYAANINNLAPLLPTVELLAQKHTSLYVRPEHYPVVGAELLDSISRVLGAAATPDIIGAWAAAYYQLAQILIMKENAIYLEAPQAADWMDFKVAKKEKESEEVTSFYLAPVDETLALPSFLPGQYISIQLDIPSLGHRQSRQYSLSDAPTGDHYRISIKRETGEHAGIVSNVMHDTVNVGTTIQVSCPRGDFVLDSATKQTDAPLVLVSGGIGLTCLNAMLQSVLKYDPTRPISWIHGARSASVRAFAAPLLDAAKTAANLQVSLFNSAGGDAGEADAVSGRIALGKLDASKTLFFDNPKAEYFVCGPVDFMVSIKAELAEKGVPDERIHTELFSVGGVPA